MRLMQDGVVPSISDVAQEAQVSRATAYRYYPTQSALIQAAVDEALGPILKWQSTSDDADERVRELITFSYPRMDDYEAPLRAALRLALDQALWGRRLGGPLTTHDDLALSLEPHARRRGRSRVHAAFAFATDLSDSVRESEGRVLISGMLQGDSNGHLLQVTQLEPVTKFLTDPKRKK